MTDQSKSYQQTKLIKKIPENKGTEKPITNSGILFYVTALHDSVFFCAGHANFHLLFYPRKLSALKFKSLYKKSIRLGSL
jgi:hypothetical protein